VNGQHANCRSCHNLVRRDWLRCLHCGIPSPVARPIGGTLLQAAFLAFATTIATAGAVHAQAIWHFVEQGSLRLVSDAVTTTAASANTASSAAPARLASGPSAAAASPVRVAQLASRVASPGQLPTVPLATVAERGSSKTALPARCLASGGAERRLDDSALVQTIAACTSVAALDSLEAQLHAAFPSDPALRRGTRALRQLEAARAQLRSRELAKVDPDADAAGPSAPMR
jgi:hypothetical protein